MWVFLSAGRERQGELGALGAPSTGKDRQCCWSPCQQRGCCALLSRSSRQHCPQRYSSGLQVYGDSQDEMGIVGYFPSNLVEEQRVYQEATKEVPTTVSVCRVIGEGLPAWILPGMPAKPHHAMDTEF